MVELAQGYNKGDWGFTKNPDLALHWFKAAAAKGSSFAMYELVKCIFVRPTG